MKLLNFIVFLLLLPTLFTYAQNGETVKTANSKADKLYQKLGYKEAIELYKQGKLDMASMEHIANGYRLNHDTQNAEKWYAQIVLSSENPVNFLYYAQTCQSNGNLNKAKEFYLKYDKMMGVNDKRGSRLAAAIDRMIELKNPDEVVVTNVSAINSGKLDFSPAFYENGIVFVSTREPDGELKKLTSTKDLWTGDDFAALYFAKSKADGNLDKPENFSTSLSTRFHEGPLAFSKSGDQVFFTRNNVKNNAWTLLKQLAKGRDELKLKIYSAEKSGDDWESPKRLELDDVKANDAHPSLSADGQKLYFSSDREGGFGGMDLYVATFSNGEWSSPINLGASVNTPGNELFPFIFDDGTLYFSSDGWGGLGGLDIFYADKIDDQSWGEAVNLGAPFNSNKDDFGYILDVLGTEGYFTSAREGGAGKDDIYRFNLPKPQSNKANSTQAVSVICAFDQATGLKLGGVKVTVLSEGTDGIYQGFEEDFVVKLAPTNRPDEFAISLKKRDPFGNEKPNGNETYQTDENGFFRLPVKEGKKYILMAKKEGYQDATYEILPGSTAENCIPMQAGNCVVLSGKVLNKQYNRPIPNATVKLINLCTGEISTLKSDQQGAYSFCLDCGCDFVLQGSKPNFKDGNALATTADRDCESGDFGEAIERNILLVPSLGPNGEPAVVSYDEKGEPDVKYYDKNGKPVLRKPLEDLPETWDDMLENGVVIELENIYYDFDKYNIRQPDATYDLDRLVAFMSRNPGVKVELGSHTDCRGDDDYNRRLAENRARAAVEYVVQRGISHSRISARGYGEDQLVNECGDGIPCSEAAHQLNRRTEVRVYK
jgi:outer membrane protein OmpA-like peptidoglycan-associated protein